MATEIFKSFGSLQSELEQAKTYLKDVDENIKKLIGRDPSEILPIPQSLPPKRGAVDVPVWSRPPQIVSRIGNIGPENYDPAGKRRISVFQRLDGPPEDEVWLHPPKSLISKVIVTPREVPSRQEVLASRCTDEKSKARNKRMFGALLGTLQKFQQEETKLKSKEQKRAQVEKKIEDLEIKEKAEIRKERQELFFNRRRKLVEIKIIEIKMMRMREFATWEQRVRPRTHYILTKAKPHIQYLPRKLTDNTRELLSTSKVDIEKLIEKRKAEVLAELQRIEERIITNFELRNPKDDDDISTNKEKKQDDETNHSIKDDFTNEDCEAEIDDIINKVTNETDESTNNFNLPENHNDSHESVEKMEVDTADISATDTIHDPEVKDEEQYTANDGQWPSNNYDESISRTENSD